MATGFISPIGLVVQYFTDQGVILAGGKIQVYAAGTTTPLATYTDSTLVTPNANPMILDSSGRPPAGVAFWVPSNSQHKVVLMDANSVVIKTIDNLYGINDFSASQSGATFTGPINMSGAAVNWTRGADISSAATINLDTMTGNSAHLNGSATVTAITLTDGRFRILEIPNGSNPVITNNSTIAVQGGANYTCQPGDLLYIIQDGTVSRVSIFTSSGQPVSLTSKLQSIAASVGSSALTATLNPTTLDFRSVTLTTGTPLTRVIGAAISLTVASGATLGTASGVSSRLVLLAIDNAGTVELAITNLSGSLNLDETTLISTTALSGSSNSANVIYSTTARSNVAFRVVGFIDISEATAGTWITAPTTVQGYGGEALSALSSIGYGQTWQDLTGSRSGGTTYTNTTGKPILVVITPGGASSSGSLSIGGVSIASWTNNGGSQTYPLTSIVPPGNTYLLTISNGAITKWSELR